MRVLAWAGAPLPLFRPDARATSSGRRSSAGHAHPVCARRRERRMHCHHEKTIVIDDSVAFVGGIDLTSKAATGSTRHDHIARAVGWHDAARARGPGGGDVAAHFRMRWQRGDRGGARARPRRSERRGRTVQVVRTVPGARLRGATAWGLRHPRVATCGPPVGAAPDLPREPVPLVARDRRVLRDKLGQPPIAGSGSLVLLPARPNTGGDDTRGVLAELIEADGGRRPAPRMHAVRARTARSPTRSTCTRRSGIVDDAGSRSARRTSTSTRSSTTPR